ncbi:cytochrome P450 [Demequina salsinemoris]|uniref:cytochrome P450 n=1 Tax=Demequina salsinemoris TaxID=577470 RepID=UPI0007849A58|nr:cytochrome P450 [Demequina salsinemoris]
MTATLFTNQHPLTTDVDISSLAFWSRTFRERDESFKRLRGESPVSWHEPMEDLDLTFADHGQEGYWAVVRAADVSYVSNHHELFSSAKGHTMLHPARPEMAVAAAFLDQDPPEHTAFRKVMSSYFTPKAVKRLSDRIEERAAQIVDRVVGAGDIEFVEAVSSRLPMLTVADLLGVPEEHMEAFRENGDKLLALQDPDAGDSEEERMGVVGEAFGFYAALGTEMAEEREKRPTDDIMTALVQAEVDGRRLDISDITMVMLLLSTAGNDTTKQTTTWSVMNLVENPDQRAWLLEDYDARINGAVEEMVRWASPVIQFARTATQDVELGGQTILEGDKVGIFYSSANRDERLFEDPWRFDLSRPRNPHLGFGGGGVHYCLGNGVAKAQLRALMRNILTKLPDIELGEPTYLVNDFINGVKTLPVTIR